MGVHYHKRPIVTDGLVFQVDAANKLCGNVTDAKNMVNPTETGSFVNGTSVVDNSYSFDGVDDYIDCGTSIGDSLGDNYTGDLSVSVWFKTNIVTPTNDGIFSIGDFANSVGEFTISIYNNGLYYRLNNGGWIKTVAFTDTTSWHHLLVVYKAGSEADSKMFLDGAAVGVSSGTFPTTSLMDFAGLKTTIGAYYSQAIAMNGNISNVKIYNKSLTQAEITQNYEATKSRYIN